VNEADLHDLIEQTPTMLPLAGTSTMAIVGKEVLCGRERADLVAVELETGRPVVVEIKLASNTDRRRSLTQVLG
jgi:RecB family endonuclease NucS